MMTASLGLLFNRHFTRSRLISDFTFAGPPKHYSSLYGIKGISSTHDHGANERYDAIFIFLSFIEKLSISGELDDVYLEKRTRPRFTEEVVATIMRQILSGLKYLSSKSIVHR
jgi:serine/threonine protein kinase